MTACIPPAALSVINSAPPQGPAEAGLNVTLRVQFAPAARVVAQLFVSTKLVEILVTLEMVSDAPPVLVNVTNCGVPVTPTAWFPKVRLLGERLTVGAAWPEPARLAVCGLPAALSTIDNVPERVLAAVGANTTLTAQCAPAANVAPQPFV